MELPESGTPGPDVVPVVTTIEVPPLDVVTIVPPLRPIEMTSDPRVSITVKAGSKAVNWLWVGKPLIILDAIPMAAPSVVAVNPEEPLIDGPEAAALGGRKS